MLFFLPVLAQKTIVKTDQQWVQSYHEGRVSDKWTALLDGGFRWRDGFSQKSAYIVRAGVGYTISDKLRMDAGFAHMGLYAADKVIRHEYRPYQELGWRSSWGKLQSINGFG